MMSGRSQPRQKTDEFARAGRAAKFIFSKTKLRPKIVLILGSGLGAFADEFTRAVRIPYRNIPGFPRSTIEGHAGRLVVGKVENIPVAAMQGRVHFYEGYPITEVVFPMRVFGLMGIRAAILTNAAGAINLNFSQGALVVIRDHMNLQGANPLIGPNDTRFGPRFPDMSQAYCKPYRDLAKAEAKKLGIPIHEGIYAALSGPSFETPAEIRCFKTIGADMVGMSTVPEVIVARHMGLRVLGISCVTNMAAGILPQKLDHNEVLEAGAAVRDKLVRFLKALLPRLVAV